ncbi:MAG: hypothetical protein IJD59_10040 [Clostridia bacterium]|nr:hypothetical protein [Clostridia bacterium]
MKRKFLCLALAMLTLVSALALTSCNKATPEEGTVTRVTVDINPSVEFMVDDQNTIVSVTALNDDGSILIIGETFIGKTPEEAVELMVSIAAETGYLVEGNAQTTENTVKISVSGDSKYAQKLMKAVEKKANATLKALDIQGHVEKAEALGTEALRQMALSTSIYTEEELAAMDEKQLCNVIAQGRIETALLLTEDMRNAYYAAKEHKISFAESEEVAKVIKSLGGIYALTHSTYKAALDLYSKAITDLDELRYKLLVSPESDYQKSLVKLREAKVELLKQKNYTATLDVNGEEYVSATLTLQISEENYDKALKAYEELGKRANEAMESLISVLRQSEEKLKELEAKIFDDNIEEKLAEKAVEMEANVNALKDSFFAEFEAAHADDITAIENALLEKKAQLKASIEENA